MSTAPTAAIPPIPYQTTKVHVAAHLLARGELLVSFDETTGTFTFPASAEAVAKRLERSPKRVQIEDRRYFSKSGGRLVRR